MVLRLSPYQKNKKQSNLSSSVTSLIEKLEGDVNAYNFLNDVWKRTDVLSILCDCLIAKNMVQFNRIAMSLVNAVVSSHDLFIKMKRTNVLFTNVRAELTIALTYGSTEVKNAFTDTFSHIRYGYVNDFLKLI